GRVAPARRPRAPPGRRRRRGCRARRASAPPCSCPIRCCRLIPRSAPAECTLRLLHEASRPALPRGPRGARLRPHLPGLVPHLSSRGIPHLGGKPARPRGGIAHARSAPATALLAVPLARRAALRTDRRTGRLLPHLPR